MVRSGGGKESGLHSGFAKAAAALLALGVVFIPAVISSAWDPWRLPKELLFRSVAILLLVVGVFAATARGSAWRSQLRRIAVPEGMLCAAIVGWTAVTLAFSANRMLSAVALVTAIAAVTVFLAARLIAPSLPFTALDVCFVAPVVNALFVMVQEYEIWNPFEFPDTARGHLHSTALVGNPNDVGTFLVAPAVAAVVATLVTRDKRRWRYAAIAAVLAGGLVASSTKTAIIAYGAGLVTVALMRPRRQAIAAAVLLTLAAGASLMPQTQSGRGFRSVLRAARTRQFAGLTSDRLVPALTAIEMTKAHPVTGVGPGVFKYEFMPERVALDSKYPRELTAGWAQNFGETHNDHLQVAAETGLPGYVLFLAAIIVVAIPFRRTASASEDPRREFAHGLRLPLAVTFFVVALAQFPLQIAAPRIAFIALAALATGWDGRDE